jgi:hypothetical protein
MQVFTGHAATISLVLMLMDIVPVNTPLDFFKAQKLIEVKKLFKACSAARTNLVVVVMSTITEQVLAISSRGNNAVGQLSL